MTHHYDYRLPPDTFLARRDSNWYIGATTPQPPLPFKEQIDLARLALRALGVLATTIQRASTDPGTAYAGELAAKFANETGARLVSEAESGQDAAKLARVQGATKAMIAALKTEVVPAIISRFLAVKSFGLVGLVLPADVLNKANEVGMQAADSALEAGKDALKTGAKGVVKLGQDLLDAGLEQAGKKPFTTALLVGGAVGVLALYFYINKKR